MAKKPSSRKSSSPGTSSKSKSASKPPGGKPPQVDAPPDTHEAQFIFRGSVTQLAAATMAQIEEVEDTVVVLVESILHAPDALKDFEGQHVTVKLGSGQKVEAGHHYIFETIGWIFGDTIAVICLKLSPADNAALERTVAMVGARSSEKIRARAERAEMVVSGQVTQVKEIPREPGAPITEHDPEWQEATVRVDHLARGGKKSGPEHVTIRFSGSRDVKWAKAPKFGVGQEGVWMLGDHSTEHREMRSALSIPKTDYLVVDPEDFHPKEVMQQVLAKIE